MSKSQHHGNIFEHRVRKAFGVVETLPVQYTARFDIESAHDPEGLPTSIKATGTGIVCMADARRVFEIQEPFRLVVGAYHQVSGQKVFHQVHEFHVQPDEWQTLQGHLPLGQVAAFHQKLTEFKEGDHEAARQWAKTRKAELGTQYPEAKLQLTPKIDSKKQRRLQASIHLKDLIDAVADHRCHQTDYRGLKLPLTLASTSRERRKPSESQEPG